MEKSKLILNGIFYIIITIIFIILFVKEKQIGAFIKLIEINFQTI